MQNGLVFANHVLKLFAYFKEIVSNFLAIAVKLGFWRVVFFYLNDAQTEAARHRELMPLPVLSDVSWTTVVNCKLEESIKFVDMFSNNQSFRSKLKKQVDPIEQVTPANKPLLEF